VLRIVGGTLSGRRFVAPPGQATRPTTERVREALGSLLESRGLLRDAQVLDLFAGSGALAFEALSRGAQHAVLVDKDARCTRLIEQNASELGVSERTRVVRAVLGPLRAVSLVAKALPNPATLVFVDPPYAEVAAAVTLLHALLQAGTLARGARIVLEHAHKQPPSLVEGFTEIAQYRYGDSALKLWGLADDEEP